MKKLISYITIPVIAIVIAISAASANETEIIAKSRSERTDVFIEVRGEETPPKGFVDVVIKASIKTHLEGYYIMESKKSLHGKPEYPFVLNIDGQGVLWKADGQRHEVPAYDGKGKTNTDPEAGEGMKYVLEKRIRLAAGSHKIFFGLPEENYSAEIDITLKKGGTHVLEFKPIYRYKTRPYRIPTFMKGIKDYEVFLDGKQLQ
jgi:hypothetical protein